VASLIISENQASKKAWFFDGQDRQNIFRRKPIIFSNHNDIRGGICYNKMYCISV